MPILIPIVERPSTRGFLPTGGGGGGEKCVCSQKHFSRGIHMVQFIAVPTLKLMLMRRSCLLYVCVEKIRNIKKINRLLSIVLRIVGQKTCKFSPQYEMYVHLYNK